MRTPVKSHATMTWVALGIVYVIWGSTYLAIRVAVRTIPPLTMAAVRFILSGALLYAVTIRSVPRAERPTREQWRAATIVGGLLLVGGNGGVIIAERHNVPSGVVALLVATVPLWMALIGRVAYREHLPRIALTGLAVGFGGVALLARPAGGGSLGYTMLVPAATLAWAAGSLWARTAPLPKRALLATAMEMFAGGVLFLILAALTGELTHFHASQVTWRSAAALGYLFVFGSLVAFTAYVWLLANAPTTLVSTYAYVNPVIAVLLGWAILSEKITGVTIAGGVIILAAVALIVSAQRPSPEASVADVPPPPEPARS